MARAAESCGQKSRLPRDLPRKFYGGKRIVIVCPVVELYGEDWPIKGKKKLLENGFKKFVLALSVFLASIWFVSAVTNECGRNSGICRSSKVAFVLFLTFVVLFIHRQFYKKFFT